jgi:hypothetical protein
MKKRKTLKELKIQIQKKMVEKRKARKGIPIRKSARHGEIYFKGREWLDSL